MLTLISLSIKMICLISILSYNKLKSKNIGNRAIFLFTAWLKPLASDFSNAAISGLESSFRSISWYISRVLCNIFPAHPRV